MVVGYLTNQSMRFTFVEPVKWGSLFGTESLFTCSQANFLLCYKSTFTTFKEFEDFISIITRSSNLK